MDRYDEALFDDSFDEAEGPASSFDEFDEADEMDSSDEFDEGDEADAGDEMDAGDEADEGDSFEAYDEFDEGEQFDESDDDQMDEMLAFALGAEENDEFLGRIAKGLRSVGKFAWKNRRAILRTVGKVAPMIPGVGTAIGTAANIAGQLLADEASDEEALDAFAEYAVRSPEAIPLVAGLAARAVLGRQAPRLSMAARRQAVRSIRSAATQLVQRRGPSAIRALPRIVRSVRRTAVARRTPYQVRPRVVAGTVRRLVRQPQLGRRLVRPYQRGRQVLGRAGALAARYGRYSDLGRPRGGSFGAYGGGSYGHGGGGRRITIRGPVTISIRPN